MRSAGIGLVAACCLLSAAAAAAARTHTVLIDGTAFVPAEVTVQRGDRVVWINKDPFPHTVTARDRRFDSGSIPPGKSWTYRARVAGTFPYGCTLHSTMQGTLIVR